MKPSELRLLTEKAKQKAIEDQRLAAKQNEQMNRDYVESWYEFHLRIIPSILVEAANSGMNEVSVFDWATNNVHAIENLEIATRLEANLKKDEHFISYRESEYQASYDAPVQYCRSLVVSW